MFEIKNLIQLQIVKYLYENERKTVNQLSVILDLPYYKIYYHIQYLLHSHVVEKTFDNGKIYYDLTSIQELVIDIFFMIINKMIKNDKN